MRIDMKNKGQRKLFSRDTNYLIPIRFGLNYDHPQQLNNSYLIEVLIIQR